MHNYYKYKGEFMKELLLDKRLQTMVNDYVPQGEILDDLVCFFSIFSDYTRLKMISALAISEMCVTDISSLLQINQTTVSHQLKTLKEAEIVKSERKGKCMYYSLADIHVKTIISQGMIHLDD